VGRARAASTLTVAMGRAGWPGRRAATAWALTGGALASATDPHDPQSGQQPTHFGGRWPQTSHSYATRAFAPDDFALDDLALGPMVTVAR